MRIEEIGAATLVNGDCREVMRSMDASSIDAIVTDPPYGLGFMGKGWDHGVPDKEFWVEALHVAKPGAHLLAFGGTRTFHRLMVAIEDAGWEIRDTIMWVYGSGFPKSLDVSKAIDKTGATSTAWFGEWIKHWRGRHGLSQKDLCERCGFFGSTNHGGTVANWESGIGAPTAAQFNKVCEVLDLPFASIKEAQRVAIGVRKISAGVAFSSEGPTKLEVTTPATDAAKQWEGWGTALKPAYEPIIVARKPLVGTVAANVLAHGTGAINIDGCRVGTTDNLNGGAYSETRAPSESEWASLHSFSGKQYEPPTGRWPANLVHDGSDEVLALFPDSGGSAARFFYCAKASRKDRDSGLDTTNIHSTVKPTDLMRYLCRLVTPPGGTVLDPFMGSGSTGKAASREGFGFVGIDNDEEHGYFDIACARVKAATLPE